jgi:hypothetical protein
MIDNNSNCHPAIVTIVDIVTMLDDLRIFGCTYSLDLRDSCISLALWAKDFETKCFSEKQASEYKGGVAPVVGSCVDGSASLFVYSNDNQDELFGLRDRLSDYLREKRGNDFYDFDLKNR